MAKLSKVIPDFSGGLVSFTDPRDLSENQCTDIENFSVRHIGTLKQLGKFSSYSSSISDISATIEGGSSPMNFDNGQIFYTFATDHKKDSSVASESYIATVDKSTGKIWVHDNANKVWQELKPYTNGANVWSNGGTKGIYGKIATSMTSNDAEDAAYYFADGIVRICDPNFSNGTDEGPRVSDYRGSWSTTAWEVNDSCIFDTGTNSDNRQYICTSAHTATNDDVAGTGRPVDGSGNINTQWKLQEDQKASTMHLSHIKRDYFNGSMSVDNWHTHPARCFPPDAYISGTNSGTLSPGFNLSSDTSAKNVTNGSVGFTLNLARDKGDGTLLMQGRKFYATFTYDGRQESTPQEIGTITLANIQSLAPAPTLEDLQYKTSLSSKAEYQDDNLHLKLKVDDMEEDSDFVPIDNSKNWEITGQVKLTDNNSQVQLLSFSGFAEGSEANGNLFTGTQDGGSSNTTMTDSTASFEVDGLIGMYIKNTTTGKYGLITDNTATTVITSSQSGFWVNGQAYRIEGTTLTGVTGWTDSGSCTIYHAVENGSIVVTNGVGNYSSAPSVSFAAPPAGGTQATGTAVMSGSGSTQSIVDITMSNKGAGYTSGPPAITISGDGEATCEVTGTITLEQKCINHDGAWGRADANAGNQAEFDPAGEIQKDDENLGFRLTCSVEPRCQVAGKFQLFEWNKGGNRVTHINVYTNKYSDDAGTIPETEDFAYVCSFDLENGFIGEDGEYDAWTADSSETTQFNSTSIFYGQLFDNNFQNRTGMFPDTWHTGMRFKTATIINRRVYAGNVFMKEAGESQEQSFPDRVVKSLPNQFDNFTDYDILDVTVDDGDSIVSLQTFGGQLLQFKKGSLYVIDVTTEPEFIRAKHSYRGVPSAAAIAQTDFGVAFGNAYGAFLYNGEIVSELTTNIIEDEWTELYDRTRDDLVVGFHPEFKILFFTKGGLPTATDSTFLVYDMTARSWSKGYGLGRYTSHDKSKFFVYQNQLTSAYKEVLTAPGNVTLTSADYDVYDAGSTGYISNFNYDSWTGVNSRTYEIEIVVDSGANAEYKWRSISGVGATNTWSDAQDITVVSTPKEIEDGWTVKWSTDTAGNYTIGDKITITVPTTSDKIVFNKWDEKLTEDLSRSYNIFWKSREYDFGNPSVNKFIYKVYVTYKTSGAGSANVQLKAIKNDGTGNQDVMLNDGGSGAFSGTSGQWNTIECTPASKINCKTVQLQIENSSTTVVDYGFEVNDIIFVYREKNIK